MEKQSVECPHCGSTAIELDHVKDILVCQNCGTRDTALVWHLPYLIGGTMTIEEGGPMTNNTYRVWFTDAGAVCFSILIFAESEQAARQEQERYAKTKWRKEYGCGEIALVGKMLVVGQEVDVASGVYGLGFSPKVVEVTASGVKVGVEGGEVYRFDNEGVSCDGEGTFECGPYIIVDICPHVLDSDGYHCERCWHMLRYWEAK